MSDALRNDTTAIGTMYRAIIVALTPIGTPTGNPYAPTPDDVATYLAAFLQDRGADPVSLLPAFHYALSTATQPQDTDLDRFYRDAAHAKYKSDDIDTNNGRVDIASDGSGAWIPARVWITAAEL